MRRWLDRWIRGEDWMVRAVRRGLAAYVRETGTPAPDRPSEDRDRDAGHDAEAATTIP